MHKSALERSSPVPQRGPPRARAADPDTGRRETRPGYGQVALALFAVRCRRNSGYLSRLYESYWMCGGIEPDGWRDRSPPEVSGIQVYASSRRAYPGTSQGRVQATPERFQFSPDT